MSEAVSQGLWSSGFVSLRPCADQDAIEAIGDVIDPSGYRSQVAGCP
jgi:hypothetical protein